MILQGLDFKTMLLRLPIIFIAISIHEYAHGYAALKMGDGTAKACGRLSLNPLAHMDIIGALCMLLIGFGWAKPVPVNSANFRNKKQGYILVSLAGPLANFFLALVGAVLYGLFLRIGFGGFNSTFREVFFGLLQMMIIMNLSFGVFNLIPIPPLDGSKIVAAFLPYKALYKMQQFEKYSFIVLLVLLYTGIIGRVLSFIINPMVASLNIIIRLIAG